MTQSSTPLCLWDYCCKHVVELRNRTARPLPQLNGRTPYEILTGNTPDISEFLEFVWYQLVWYYETQVFPNQTRLPARWLGVAHRVGQAMCYWLLPESGVLIARTTIKCCKNPSRISMPIFSFIMITFFFLQPFKGAVSQEILLKREGVTPLGYCHPAGCRRTGSLERSLS